LIIDKHRRAHCQAPQLCTLVLVKGKL